MIFSRTSADFYGNIILQFLQENVPIFNRKIIFPAKNVKFSYKNQQIFLKKWKHFPESCQPRKFYDFFKEIC